MILSFSVVVRWLVDVAQPSTIVFTDAICHPFMHALLVCAMTPSIATFTREGNHPCLDDKPLMFDSSVNMHIHKGGSRAVQYRIDEWWKSTVDVKISGWLLFSGRDSILSRYIWAVHVAMYSTGASVVYFHATTAITDQFDADSRFYRSTEEQISPALNRKKLVYDRRQESYMNSDYPAILQSKNTRFSRKVSRHAYGRIT